MDGYSLRLVLSLHQAAQQNQRAEMVAVANAVSAGVSNSLDLAFNGGKGNIMKRFADLLLKTEMPEKKPHPNINQQAAAFLSGLPVRNMVEHG